MKSLRLVILAFASMFLYSCCATTTAVLPLGTYHRVGADPTIQIHKVIPVWIDQHFDKAHRAEVVSALNEWNMVLNGYIVYDVKDQFFDKTSEEGKKVLKSIEKTDEGLVIEWLSDDDPMFGDSDIEGLLGVTNDLGRPAHEIIMFKEHFVSDDMAAFHTVVMHELGHCAGVRHNWIKGNLMYPYYDGLGRYQSPCVDKLTAIAVAQYWGIPVEHLNYCSSPLFP